MADSLERYYDTLGLRPGASPEEVRRAYLDLTKVWHPDRFAQEPRLKERAEAQLREINEAYEHLCAERPAEPPRRAARRRPVTQAPVAEVMALLILAALLAVLGVALLAWHQLTSSPVTALLLAAATGA